jgi:hypothetical protein
MDHGGAVGHAFPDLAATATPLEQARRLGIDPVKIKPNTDAYSVLGYTADPDVLDAQLATYRAALGADFPLSCTLRPMHPDCDSPENLDAKLQVTRQHGLTSVDFYHYALMPMERLDWLRRLKVPETRPPVVT